MAKPVSLREQMREISFKPDRKLVVYFATSKFDAVWLKHENEDVKQFYENLPQCKEDCKTVRIALERYKILDTGPKENMR